MGAVTSSFALLRPPGASVNLPLPLLRLNPGADARLQPMSCAVPSSDCAPSSSSAFAPGVSTKGFGEAKPTAEVKSLPYEGGASLAADAQAGFGALPITNSSTPPVSVHEGSSQARLLGMPFTFNAWM